MGCVPCGARKANQAKVEYLVSYRDGTTEIVATATEGRRKLVTEGRGGGSVKPIAKRT